METLKHDANFIFSTPIFSQALRLFQTTLIRKTCRENSLLTSFYLAKQAISFSENLENSSFHRQMDETLHSNTAFHQVKRYSNIKIWFTQNPYAIQVIYLLLESLMF